MLVCKGCGTNDSICAVERVPRSISIGELSFTQHPPGEERTADSFVDFEFHPETFDEAFWEVSETVSFECLNPDCPLYGQKFATLPALLAESGNAAAAEPTSRPGR